MSKFHCPSLCAAASDAVSAPVYSLAVRRIRPGLAITVPLLCWLIWTAPLQAAPVAKIIYVDAAAGGANTGDSWTDAYPSLQSGLASATEGDEIWVATGVYTPGTTAIDFFALKNGVALYGGFAGGESERSQRDWNDNRTVLSGDIGSNDQVNANGVITTPGHITGTNSVHVVIALNITTPARLDGFVITGGNAVLDVNNCALGCGGGLYAVDSQLILDNLLVRGNRAYYGAGMTFLSTSKPTLTDSVILYNQALVDGGGLYTQVGVTIRLARVNFATNQAVSSGGGAFFDNNGLELDDVTFATNRAGEAGGGAYLFQNTGLLREVTFTGNYVDKLDIGSGGGLYVYDSRITLAEASFVRNRSSYEGGGMTVSSSIVTMTTSLWQHNSADFQGGGLVLDLSEAWLHNSTWQGNRTGSYGGGMYANQTVVWVSRSTFQGNRAFEGGGIYNNQAGNGALFINTVLFNGNVATDFGGGLYNYNSSPTLTNVTWHGNAAALGSAIYNAVGSAPLIQNSIVWGNNAPVVPIFQSSGNRIRHSLIEGGVPGNAIDEGHNVDGDPRFLAPVNCGADGCTDDPATAADESANDEYGDQRLGPGSLALDGGHNDHLDDDANYVYTPNLDLAGLPRIIAGKLTTPTVDIGAYERENSGPTADAGGPYLGVEGTPLPLDGSASSDDGAICTYGWDCTNDGTPDTALASPTGSTCLYADSGTYTLRLTVTDGPGLTNSTTGIATIANIDPTYTAAMAQFSTAGIARAFTLGTFSDPGVEGNWSVTVDWGDDSPPTQFSVAKTGELPTRQHSYAVARVYDVTVRVNDGEGEATGSFQVIANPAPAGAPQVSAPPNQNATTGVEHTFALGSFSDPGSTGPWSITINWGDGSTTTLFNVAATGPLPAQTHIYATAGAYQVVVTVNDGGLNGAADFQVTVTQDNGNGQKRARYLPAIRS